ncbi:MAG: DUF1684 domain-containing protein [Bacteroidales bacterium]
MRTKLFVPVLLLSVFLTNYIFAQVDEQEIKDHKKEVEDYRMAKDQQILNLESSPLSSDQKTNFKGLNYFPIDMNYKINAQFAANSRQSEVSLSKSNGGTIQLKNIGEVTFNLNGESITLEVFQNNNLPEFASNANQLFIPFSDLSNGNETNAGGRYLPIELPAEGNTVVLDFNYAMNPYSAMNDEYFSVIPPGGNLIEQTIGSGERKFEDR